MAKSFTLYHLVTGTPLAAGQQFLVDGEEPSPYSKALFNKEVRLRDGRDLSALMEENDQAEALHPDEEESAKLREYFYSALCAESELVLELVRLWQHPRLPSRLCCLYGCKSREEAELWRQLLVREHRPAKQLVRLRVEGSCFMGDAALLPDRAALPLRDKFLQAEEYWSGLLTGELNEVLATGRVTVEAIEAEYK